MPSRTAEFVEACSQRNTLVSAPTSTSTSDALRKRRKRKQQQQQGSRDGASAGPSSSSSSSVDVSDPDVNVWTLEAGRISSSLQSLAVFLSSIRRAYLDLSHSHARYNSKGKGSAEGAGSRDLDLSKGLLEAWKDVKWLSDRERDEVDWQAKTMLKRCMDRVKELDKAESNRHARAHSVLSRVPTNNLTRFFGLPANILSSTAQLSEEQLHAHRQQVVLWLSRRLADVGRAQQEQQEARVKRQLERQNLSSNFGVPAASSSTKSNGLGKRDDPEAVPAMFVPAPLASTAYTDDSFDGNGADEAYEPIDALLSSAQIQQFESESSALLQEANSQLAAIEKAQTSLLEISQLQSELAVHLGQQMELTDKLWEDSVLVSGRVEEGNVQLRKARERNREGRIWLLVFLVGASLSLLFLEYY